MLRMDGSKAIRIIGMPADAQIVGMTDSTIHYYDDVQFVIESSEFPVVPPNSLIPDLILQCSSFDTPVAKAELEKLEK